MSVSHGRFDGAQIHFTTYVRIVTLQPASFIELAYDCPKVVGLTQARTIVNSTSGLHMRLFSWSKAVVSRRLRVQASQSVISESVEKTGNRQFSPVDDWFVFQLCSWFWAVVYVTCHWGSSLLQSPIVKKLSQSDWFSVGTVQLTDCPWCPHSRTVELPVSPVFFQMRLKTAAVATEQADSFVNMVVAAVARLGSRRLATSLQA